MSNDLIETVATVLEGIHLCAAAEATALSVASGLDIKTLHPIIVGAAGNSKSWETLVPELWSPTFEASSQYVHFEKKYTEALAKVRAAGFPTTLGNVALQYFSLTAAAGASQLGFPGMVKTLLGTQAGRLKVEGSTGENLSGGSQTSFKPKKTAFIGLGSMGFGMASSLVRSGAEVMGYDVWAPSVDRFVAEGGARASSLVEVVTGADAIVLMVISIAQANEALSSPGVFDAIKDGAVIILHSTVAPTEAVALGERIENFKGKTLHFVDAPVSGGPPRAYDGDLTIMASGSSTALSLARSSLLACATQKGKLENLCIVPGPVGGGTKVKLANQLLAGVQVAASSETLAMAAHLGLDTKEVHEYVKGSGAMSWMWGFRGLHTVEGDLHCYSAINILVKDLGIVISEGLTQQVPVFLPAVAHQYFLQAANNGWGKDDDSTLYRLWGVNAISKSKLADSK